MAETWLMQGDCVEMMKKIPSGSIDAVVTDPPYGLSFMGKKWDYDVPSVEVWAECLRVLKPGGHLLAFAGTRTQHRMAVRIEDAGFEIRDMIAWVYGSGFPKNHDVSKAIDKAAGVEREVVGVKPGHEGFAHRVTSGHMQTDEDLGVHRFSMNVEAQARYHALTAPATDAARQWQGWGTALKPALEPITVARKPLAGTVAENVQQFGTGALNIDGCRVATGEVITATRNVALGSSGSGVFGAANVPGTYAQHDAGRFPANLIHDGSPEVLAGFPDTAMSKRTERPTEDYRPNGKNAVYGSGMGGGAHAGFDDTTRSAARFFYCAKASKSDRGDGNNHPTVKPTDLMRYLCRLVTPPGGAVLDPFMGSGSTGKAAILEGFNFVGIERDAEYMAIARARIASANAKIAS